MNSTGLSENGEAVDDLAWPRVRAWLHDHPALLAGDRALLEELGLRATGRNVVDFGRAALTRLEAVVEREADARRRIEATARANYAAQVQTHAAALDLMEARNHADLARRLDAAAQARFGLVAATLSVEKPGPVPFGWRALETGRVDALLGVDGLTWLGPAFTAPDLFDPAPDAVRSFALVRLTPRIGPGGQDRPALCAFGSAEPEGFGPDMGCELIAFVTATVERIAGRWPAPSA